MCFPLSVQDACLAKQSMDNMSVLVIAFKGAWEEGAISEKFQIREPTCSSVNYMLHRVLAYNMNQNKSGDVWSVLWVQGATLPGGLFQR